jgi:alkylated DNA repair dioxygenase AlkB
MIKGLNYYPDFLSLDEESEILSKIEEGTWQSVLKRRVQQYGPIYNYSTRTLNNKLEEVPKWICDLIYPKLMKLGKFFIPPNQIIINEYKIGQGITKHTDASVFGPTIASLSLLSDTNIIFGQNRNQDKNISKILERRSLIILTDEARANWHHHIPPVKEKRISITFRTIL